MLSQAFLRTPLYLMHGKVTIGLTCPVTFLFFKLKKLNKMFVNVKLSYIAPHKHTDYITKHRCISWQEPCRLITQLAPWKWCFQGSNPLIPYILIIFINFNPLVTSNLTPLIPFDLNHFKFMLAFTSFRLCLVLA